MLRLITGLFVLCIGAASAAQEQEYSLTGNALLRKCDGPYTNEIEKLANTSFCAGYIQGMQQMHHVVIGFHKVGPLYCEPTATGNYDQLEKVVVKWLKNNPKQLHRDARLLVTRSFIESFPCR